MRFGKYHTLTILMIFILILSATVNDSLAQNQEEFSTDDVNIVVWADDISRLPSKLASLSEGTNSVVTNASEVIDDSTIDAVIISKETLTSATVNTVEYSDLHKLIDNQKQLLVYDATTTDIAKHLSLKMPVTETETTRYVVASAVKDINGKFITGGILISKDASVDDPKIDLTQDVIDYVTSTKNELHDASQNTVNETSPHWDYVGTLINNWDLCNGSGGYGKYNEVVAAEKAYPDSYSDSYSFWEARIKQQTIGGFSACEKSNYRIATLRTRADPNFLLYDYGPTTTNPEFTDTASVGIGLEAGSRGATFNLAKEWSFTLSGVNVIDHSDFDADYSQGWAEWSFGYDINSAPAKYTYLSEPGITARIEDGYAFVIYRAINTYWREPPFPYNRYVFDNWTHAFYYGCCEDNK
ncbi:MAG: hypothetical protein AAGF95_10515 [Chloroflexota bacterium]